VSTGEGVSCVAKRHTYFRCRRIGYASADVRFHHWKLGFKQSSFYHTDRTCRYYYTTYLRASLLYTPCYFPLWVSPSGRVVVLEGSYPQPSAPLGQSSACRSGALPHLAYRPESERYSLPPFVMYRALPRSFGYYGGSVTIGLASRRRSRIYAHETCSACRRSIRLLAPFITGCSSQRAFHSIVPPVIM
jgi:hypothetical protein